MTNYERSVDAALSETASKFQLAEALALDIPKAQGTDNVTSQLEEIRERIIEAGGEPKAVGTLRNYRQTALHFTRKHVEWAEGYSFTAHMEAAFTGIHPDEFRANPKTVREIRQENGQASKDGSPTAVIAGWSQEQKEDALEQLRDEAFQAVADEMQKQREATATKQSADKKRTKEQVTSDSKQRELDLAMAEIMHFSRDTIRRAENMARKFDAVMPNPWWGKYHPGETVHRTHEERVLGDIDKADEAIQKARIAIAKIIDKSSVNA